MTPEQLLQRTGLETKFIKDMLDAFQAELDEKIHQAEQLALNGDARRAARLLIETATLRKVMKYGKRE